MENQTNKRFWNIKTDGKQSKIDLFGFVGGDKTYGDGFNSLDFLKEMNAIPAENELYITINSHGGDIDTARSIYTQLTAHKGKITIRVNGVAMSAATIITSVPGAHVIMPQGSLMMIHRASCMTYGNAENLRKMADTLEKYESDIIGFYMAKTGKTETEIREKVNAETYFNPQEAVEFGLADEIDDKTIVKNCTMENNIVNVNGLSVDMVFFAHAPESFINKAEQHVSAVENQAEKKEDNPMLTLETLKAEHPEIVDAIRNEALKEGAKAERARFQAIDDLGVTGHDELINSAKFGENPMTAEQVAVAVLKAEKGKLKNIQTMREADAKPLNEVAPVSNDGIILNSKKEKTRDELIAEAKAEFEAAKNA